MAAPVIDCGICLVLPEYPDCDGRTDDLGDFPISFGESQSLSLKLQALNILSGLQRFSGLFLVPKNPNLSLF